MESSYTYYLETGIVTRPYTRLIRNVQYKDKNSEGNKEMIWHRGMCPPKGGEQGFDKGDWCVSTPILLMNQICAGILSL